MRMWVYNPHSGGKKAPPAVQERIRDRILKHAAKKYAGRYDRIDVRFRGALCYVDAYVESSPYPLHLVRLRYNGNEDFHERGVLHLQPREVRANVFRGWRPWDAGGGFRHWGGVSAIER